MARFESLAENPAMTLSDVFDPNIVLYLDFLPFDGEVPDGEKRHRTQLFGKVVGWTKHQDELGENRLVRDENNVCMGVTLEALKAMSQRIKESKDTPRLVSASSDMPRKIPGISTASEQIIDAIIKDRTEPLDRAPDSDHQLVEVQWLTLSSSFLS